MKPIEIGDSLNHWVEGKTHTNHSIYGPMKNAIFMKYCPDKRDQTLKKFIIDTAIFSIIRADLN